MGKIAKMQSLKCKDGVTGNEELRMPFIFFPFSCSIFGCFTANLKYMTCRPFLFMLLFSAF